MMGGYGMFGYGGGGFGWLFMILWLVLIVGGIVAFVRWVSTPSSGLGRAPPAKSALDILKERYARGEINKEEFEQKKRDLQA